MIILLIIKKCGGVMAKDFASQIEGEGLNYLYIHLICSLNL
jgi:hypothetical protein